MRFAFVLLLLSLIACRPKKKTLDDLPDLPQPSATVPPALTAPPASSIMKVPEPVPFEQAKTDEQIFDDVTAHDRIPQPTDEEMKKLNPTLRVRIAIVQGYINEIELCIGKPLSQAGRRDNAIMFGQRERTTDAGVFKELAKQFPKWTDDDVNALGAYITRVTVISKTTNANEFIYSFESDACCEAKTYSGTAKVLTNGTVDVSENRFSTEKKLPCN